jgi:hypothetical protein
MTNSCIVLTPECRHSAEQVVYETVLFLRVFKLYKYKQTKPYDWHIDACLLVR